MNMNEEYKESPQVKLMFGLKKAKKFLDYIYNGACIYLDRKYNKYKSWG